MNAVFKDMKNHPAGYIRESDGKTACRVRLTESAQIVLIFKDGSERMLEMERGEEERILACDVQGLCHAYVFRGETLLLATDAAARDAFRKRRSVWRRPACDERTRCHDEINAAQQTGGEQPVIEQKKTMRPLPHRRWPPPNWTNASYLGGMWIERGKENGGMIHESERTDCVVRMNALL